MTLQKNHTGSATQKIENGKKNPVGNESVRSTNEKEDKVKTIMK